MGYENRFSLEIIGEPTITVLKCSVDCSDEVKTGKFCSDCGASLKEVDTPLNTSKIIKELLEFSGECSYLINENGGSEECGSGNHIRDEIKNFSLKYEDILFQLDTVWDSGFGDETPDRDFIKNGKCHSAIVKTIFEDFDESKLQ